MGHLPLLTEVIGAMRGMISKSSPAKQLSRILQSHWHIRNIYTKTIHYIEVVLTDMYTEFMLVRKQFLKGNPSQTTLDRYNKLKGLFNSIFDISTNDTNRIRTLETQHNVKMGHDEVEYLRSQKDCEIARTDGRKLSCYPCANAIDLIWESQQKRRESRETYQQRQIRDASDQLQTSSEADMDIDNGARQGTSYDEDFNPGDLNEEAQQTSKKKKIMTHFLLNIAM